MGNKNNADKIAVESVESKGQIYKVEIKEPDQILVGAPIGTTLQKAHDKIEML